MTTRRKGEDLNRPMGITFAAGRLIEVNGHTRLTQPLATAASTAGCMPTI